jgi:hypothetical protein
MQWLTPAAIVKIARKLVGQARLLQSNPDELLRNVRQFTNPVAFRERLLDLAPIPAIATRITAATTPTLNIFLPAISRQTMTGGPNTVLNIGYRLATAGIAVRFVSCNQPIEADMGWFWRHLEQLTGVVERPPSVAVQSAVGMPLDISVDDLFMASFWTTAHQIVPLLGATRRRTFLYLIQDFEPGFYAWSSNHAMALETYGLPFRAIINEASLADHLFESRAGRFADPAFRAACAVFEPAIDRRVFHPPTADTAARPHRLLVYARPSNPRNLLGIAVAALRSAAADPIFASDWQFLSIGTRGSLPDIDIGGGRTLREAPWRDYSGYADLLRTSDILLCPMLSPHTSYPPLEMAACGGIAVTNTFSTKSANRLAALSTNIIAVAPTMSGFSDGLVSAANRLAGRADRQGPISLPATWDEALAGVQHMVQAMLAEI